MFGDYIAALSFLGDPLFWVMMFIALGLLGTIGLVPGIGSTGIAAIAIPFLIFNVDNATAAIVFLAVMAGVNNTLDSITAVLVGYPGAATQVTYLEGQRIARRGEAAYLMGAIYVAEGLGAIVGALALLITIPLMRPVLANFSYPEIAALALWGIFMVAALSRGAMRKGLIAGLLGMLLSTIGPDYFAGVERFSFGQLYLFEGLPLIPVLVGIFALPELIDLAMFREPVGQAGTVNTREVLRGARYAFTKWRMIMRQSIFGVFMGAIPGVGSAVIDWLAYAFGIAFTKDKSEFGKGSVDGVLFAESAQNSKEGGQAIPTLAFGIPGGSAWALVIAGMLFFGVAPGFGMLDRHLDVLLAVVVALALGNVFLAVLGLVATGQLAKLTLVPYSLLAAALLPLMVIAAYQTTQDWGDIWVLFGIGALGLTMKWLGWPRPPFILGFILGPVVEQNLIPAIQIFGPLGMVTRPISIILLILAVVSVVYLTRAISRGAETAERTLATPAGGANEEPTAPLASGNAAGLRGRLAALSWHWNPRSLFTLLVLGLGILFLMKTLDFRVAETRFAPYWLSLGLIVGAAMQLVAEGLSSREQGEIMDLSMRSGTGREAFHKLLVIAAWLAGLTVATAIIGLPYAAVAFAVLFALAFYRPRGRRIALALIPGIFLALIVFVLLDRVMGVFWPDKFILGWFGFNTF